MLTWKAAFGETILDGHVATDDGAGEPFLRLPDLIESLIADGWTRWTDPDSGSISAFGPGVKLWQGVSVRSSILCEGVIVGHCSEVLSSIVMTSTKINHLNVVGRSVLGPRVSITSHVVFASHRLDDRNVVLPDGLCGRLSTLPKFGAVVGHDAVIGAHAVVDAGAIVRPHEIVPPLSLFPGRLSRTS